MTSTNKLFIFQSKQWICRVEKFWMKNNFHAIINAIKKIATSYAKINKEIIIIVTSRT